MALPWAAALAALAALLAAAHATTPAPPAATPLLAVAVNPKKMAALVGERFISLTMDPMELSEHRKLGPGVVRTQAMAEGLAPALLRLAGPSSDTLHFAAGSAASGNGTVTEADLLSVSAWTRTVGWDLVVALNALSRDHGDNWDATEARQLLAVADHHGLPVGLQLGYEAGALDRAGVSGSRLGADLSTAHSLLAEFPRYQDALLLGPDVAAALAAGRAARDAAHFLQDETRASSPDAVVWQPWADSPEGRDPVSDLDLVREDVNRLLGRAAARRPLWIAESAATPSATSRTFSGALEWAQRVQVAARVGADVIFRQWQTLGEDHQPTPDYWVSLLHRRLCGRAVLDAKAAGDKAAATVTAQCTAAAPPSDALNARLHGSFTKLSYERGDVTLMAVNPSAADAKVAVKFSPAAGIRQAIVHEYVLTAPGHDLSSRSALLNDHLLAMDNGGVLPGLTPRVRRADRDATLEVPAHSVAFFVFPGAQARACVTAPPSAVEAEATAVPLQLRPTSDDVHVQFHVEGLPPAASKSKAKDKLTSANAKVIAKDEALKNSHRNEMLSSNGRPLAWATVTDLEQVAERADATESTPRSKRASPPPHHPPRGPPATPEDFMERLEKAQAAQAAWRKHMLSHAPQHAAQVQDEVPDDRPSTIPAAHMYRPDDKEDPPPKAAHRLPHKPFKLPSLPKRAPLVPAAPPRHGLPKRPAAPAPRFKPLPRTGAVVASLVDPARGVSAEDASVEVEDDKQDNFPTGEVFAELGESDEDAESSDKSSDLDYIEDVEDDEERGQVEAAAPQARREEVPESTDQFYFAPGEFAPGPTQGAAPAGSNRAPSDGELGEMDMIVPAMDVVQPSTPSPFEPHLEEFIAMPEPQRQNRARLEEDMTRLYQSEADAAEDLQPPTEDDEQELNTDVLIELGKKYLREKKMALKQDRGAEEAAAPSGPGEEGQVDPQQKLRRKRQAVMRLSLPTGATGKPRPRAPKPPARTGSGEDARRNRDLRKELEQRANERRERAEKMMSTSAARSREQPDRERLSRAREQFEQQRQQREQEREKQREQLREQPDRERLSRAREQFEQQRQQREQAERDRIAKAREQLQERLPPRRAERVKRSDAPCEYLDSFGRHDALAHAGHAWHKVVPAALPHHHRALQRLDGTPTARYKYGHTPQRAHKHKDVHREVLKKTNVVRYLPAEEEDAEEREKEVRRVDESSEEVPRPASNQLRRRQHYRPHDNLGALWAGSPISPLEQWVPARPVIRKEPQVQQASYEVATPDVGEAPADDESATEYAPDEVKTTEIVKTERTYETPATESWGAADAEEDAGYSSDAPSDDAETSSTNYASLEQTTQHHHHDHHHHHHQRVSKDIYRQVGRDQEQSEEQSGEQEESEQGAPAQQPLVPPEAEGEVGPLPEFPFRTPRGPKSHVVGFTADDYSPGGWYTFSSGAVQQHRQQSPAAAVSYSSPPTRQQAPVDRYPMLPAWKRPAAPDADEPQYAAPIKTRPAPQPQTVPAIRTAYSTTRVPSRPSVQQDAEVVVVPPPGSWSAAPQPHRVEVAPWRGDAVVPAEAPTVVRAGVPSWSGFSRQEEAAPDAATQYLQPPPRPQLQPQLSVGVEEAPEYLPTPQQAASPSYNPPPPRPQSAPQQKPQREVPQALAYLAKFFQPVEPVEPPTRPVKTQPARVKNSWTQPAAADNLWGQPHQTAAGWGQLAAGPASWNQPSAAAGPWAQTDLAPAEDTWSAPAPAASLWKQQASNSWGQAAPAGQQWGQLSAQVPPTQRRQSVQGASLASPGEQLLDYNKDILRYKPDVVRSAAAPALQFASLASPGMEEPDVVAAEPAGTSRPAAPAAPKPILAEWELPSHRIRRALPAASEHHDGPRRRRLARSLFYGGNKVEHPDDINDLDWSAETERLRQRKLARQRQRDQDKDDRTNIQVLRDDGVMSGIMSSLLGKVVGVIGYLGNRLTRLTGGGQA